jgi:NAD(P)H-dependent nitrite reductase small subunit
VPSEPFVTVARASEVKPGHPRTVVVDRREIALFNVDDHIYALENACPHQGAALSEGWIEGTTVTCPWHAWCFNLTDGRMAFSNFAGVDAFEVRVENGDVLVSRTPRPRETD